MTHDSRITHCSQGPHKLLFISALSQHLHRHCITQTWIYMKHLWFSFPFFRTHTSYAFNNNLFITKVYIPNRICILCEFTIIEEFSHTLLILSLKVSGRVTREDIKVILHLEYTHSTVRKWRIKEKRVESKAQTVMVSLLLQVQCSGPKLQSLLLPWLRSLPVLFQTYLSLSM